MSRSHVTALKTNVVYSFSKLNQHDVCGHMKCVTMSTCDVLRHMSQVTMSTCDVLRHMSQVTMSTGDVLRHMSQVTMSTCNVLRHMSQVTMSTCDTLSHMKRVTMSTCDVLGHMRHLVMSTCDVIDHKTHVIVSLFKRMLQGYVSRRVSTSLSICAHLSAHASSDEISTKWLYASCSLRRTMAFLRTPFAWWQKHIKKFHLYFITRQKHVI